MARKKIEVTTDRGGYVSGSWYPYDGTVYAEGTYIGKAYSLQDAIAIIGNYAERTKGGRIKTVEVRDA